MDSKAVEQAKERLGKANRAIEELKAADSYGAAESAWIDFLHATSTIYNKLEQGAKSDQKSKEWYDSKRQQRYDDQLLRYLHIARNSDQHGIELLVDRRSGNKTDVSGKPMKFGERQAFKVRKLDKKTLQPVGEETDAILEGPSIHLVRVRDKKHNYCEPPKEHLGKKLSFGGALADDIGSISLVYLAELVTEAEALVHKAKPAAQ